ncbi:archaeosine biosynthesis radical SAM protein RaSEA [Methanocaldococcus infernus]|nr:archaeosine biosynthesis radical SAM protein RaSEA [Methanocaldococcus infernus]
MIWIEDEITNNLERVKALTIILKTKGCSYRECVMCSYYLDSHKEVKDKEIIEQFEYAINKFKDFDMVKIFTSGSFLDDKEISKDVRDYILKRLSELNLKEIHIESRVEFITEDRLEELKDYNVVIGLGIESFNERVREVLNKGVSNEEIVRAISLIKKYKLTPKAYLLIKPPFLTESDAIKDAIYSGNKALELGCIVSFCPLTVHKDTLVEYFYKKGEYSPPFLWTVLEVLKNVRDGLVRCDTSGFGSLRGASNRCKCDREIIEKIKKFNLTQNREVLEHSCECKKLWEVFLETEKRNIVPLNRELTLTYQ